MCEGDPGNFGKYMKKQVLGVKIDDVSVDEASKIVEGWLKKRGKHYIVTPNPEFLVVARKDLKFKMILNAADLSIPDGAGLKIGSDIENTTPGIDLMEELIEISAEKGFTTGFLGGRNGVAKMAAECLMRKYPKLKISFIEEEPVEIPTTDILFVAFGAPKQEKWIFDNLKKIPVKVAMGVGGAFDYLSGRVSRAPIWVRNLGFEWLFRLVVQPWRIKRQLALIKFIFYVLK